MDGHGHKSVPDTNDEILEPCITIYWNLAGWVYAQRQRLLHMRKRSTASRPTGNRSSPALIRSGRQAITGRRSFIKLRTFFSPCSLHEMFRIWRRLNMMLLHVSELYVMAQVLHVIARLLDRQLATLQCAN